MDYVLLGKTGLQPSAMGLGCGGHSRLGLSQGKSESEAVAVVQAALDLGITFIDTAEGYRTESVVGIALESTPRASVILSTKAGVGWQDRRCNASELRERVHASLNRLGTDYIDVFHLHGVRLDQYEYACDELVPELLKLKTEGKIRFLGITEAFIPEPDHKMLSRAVLDDCWQVIMVGFNILNQSAREVVLRVAQQKEIGTLCMFAVRRALSQPDALREVLNQLLLEGLLGSADADHALSFLTDTGIAGSLQEAAYRFCRWEPGMDVILSGTGSVDHLRANAYSLSLPALPDEVLVRLQAMFAGVDSVSGN